MAALVVLGLVQGLCEFLPISSSGHLALLSSLFGIEDSLFISIVLHVATLFAVVVCFRKEIWQMIKHPLSPKVINLAIATIVTCIIGLALLPILKGTFDGIFLPVTFLASAIILFVTDIKTRNRAKDAKFSVKTALLIGLAQGLALFPGLSRSGTTISAGVLSGANKKECASFSFLLSIPTILASLALEVVEICHIGSVHVDVFGLIVASLVAFVVGLISIKFMIKLTEKSNFKWFAVYLSIMAIISLWLFW